MQARLPKDALSPAELERVKPREEPGGVDTIRHLRVSSSARLAQLEAMESNCLQDGILRRCRRLRIGRAYRTGIIGGRIPQERARGVYTPVPMPHCMRTPQPRFATGDRHMVPRRAPVVSA